MIIIPKKKKKKKTTTNNNKTTIFFLLNLHMIFEEHMGLSYQIFKPGSSENSFQMSSIYNGIRGFGPDTEQHCKTCSRIYQVQFCTSVCVFIGDLARIWKLPVLWEKLPVLLFWLK